MKDANENILKSITNNVHESVQFLEKLSQHLSTTATTTTTTTTTTQDVRMPTSECFQNMSAESGSYELLWERGTPLAIEQIKLCVCCCCYMT